ncbi:MAG: tRNA uridine-5-carboxymethylaminomethyl(34) synthesis GTPase MnmE [Chthoniobacterales bacterium]
MLTKADTIAAISTPAGEGAIALVRMSGSEAVQIADVVFRSEQKPTEFQPHLQHFGEIRDAEQLVDQVMLTVHRAPHSYTGEDLVEISCHGGVLVTARVLEVCLRAGARAARAGEFTERAFLHGKMDLTQAEAVIDVIRARTDLALRSATEQLEGRLGEAMRTIRDELIDLLAHVEAAIDFPDENLAPDEGERLRARMDVIRGKMTKLLDTAAQGRILREGVRVVIYGATNAGKSSLLNRLLGYERAIVSEIPGTTRDTIEEVINLRGIPLRLLDTAGLRDSTDPLEQAGIERTHRSLQTADLILHVVDRTAPSPPVRSSVFDVGRSMLSPPEILLLNKSDLPEHPEWAGTKALRISCLSDEGLAGLDDAILSRLGKQPLRAESAVAINTRHRDCLRRALEACDHAAEALGSKSAPEFAAVDLRGALAAVVEVIGVTSDDAVLDSVFAQFCIGK